MMQYNKTGEKNPKIVNVEESGRFLACHMPNFHPEIDVLFGRSLTVLKLRFFIENAAKHEFLKETFYIFR